MIQHDPQKAAYEQGCADTIERISDELERLSDSYIDLPASCEWWDIWGWTAELARRLRAGEFTKPIPTEPPF